MDTDLGWDPVVWQRLCGELGLAGLGVPEEYGGAGFGWAEVAVAFEEAGQVLLCAPMLATVGQAVPLLLSAGDPRSCADYLPRICAGTTTATVAATNMLGQWQADVAPVTAGRSADTWQVSGKVGYVVDGASAGLVFVPALAPDGMQLFVVDRTASNWSVTPLMTLDQTRKMAHLEFDATPARRLDCDDAGAALARATKLGSVLLAAECVGGAQRCLDMAVEHVRSRIQFGRAVGSFQAVKQKAADMLMSVESARSAAMAAATAARTASGDQPSEGSYSLALTAAVAKSYCGDAFMAVAADNIQLHGGIGFTWEHDAHLYFKRARSNQELFGSSDIHVAAIAHMIESDPTL